MQTKWRFEIPQLLILAGMFIVAAIAWQSAPDSVPVHWNIRGEVDRHGGKFEGLMLMPLIATGMYLLLLVLPMFDPGRANYESFQGAYLVIRYATLILMAVIYICILLATFGFASDLGLVIPIAVGILFIVLGNVMGKIRPNWFVGIRTPWTLSSRHSWNKTHRLARWLFVAMGITIGACSVFRNLWMVVTCVAVVIVSMIWMVVYSYLMWRVDPERLSPAAISPAADAAEIN